MLVNDGLNYGVFKSAQVNQNNTFGGTNTFATINANKLKVDLGLFGNGLYLFTQPNYIDEPNGKTFVASDFGINQVMILQPNLRSDVILPDPTTCQGQTLNLWSNCSVNITIRMTPNPNFTNSQFVGKANGYSFVMPPNSTCQFISNYYYWIVINIDTASVSQNNSFTGTNNFSTLSVGGTDILSRISNAVSGLLLRLIHGVEQIILLEHYKYQV